MPAPPQTHPGFLYTLTEYGSEGERDAIRAAVHAMQIATADLDIDELTRLSAVTFVYIDAVGVPHRLPTWLDAIRRQSASERKAGMIVQDILVSGGLAFVTGFLEGMPHPLPLPPGGGHGAQSAQTWGMLDGLWRRMVLRQPRP